MNKTLACGCVDGFYWCNKHDIYTKQEPNDPPQRVRDFEVGAPDECTCHISAPCSFCFSHDSANGTTESA